VEKDEDNLPKLVVSLNNAENATLRLKGTKDGPWTLKPENPDSDANTVNIKNLSRSPLAFIHIGPNNTTNNKLKTFILGSNITIESREVIQGSSYYLGVFNVGYNATLILEKGSTITGHDSGASDSEYSGVIYVHGATGNTSHDTKRHGAVHIEGGSITNCKVHESRSLIRFQRQDSWYAPGSFYLAPSSGLTLSGNSNDEVWFKTLSGNTPKWDLTQYLDAGLSAPAAK
jgi:hypothetical protein